MTQPDNSQSPGFGEQKSRLRTRRELIVIGVGSVLGGVIGFTLAFADKGRGNLFAGQWSQLSFDPPIAIVLAIALLVTLVVLPIWCFSLTDELMRDRNLIGFTGGCIAVLGSFPIWAVLHAGGCGAAPTPFGIWIIGFVGMFASFAFAWMRGG